MWHVSSRSRVATLRTAMHLLLTYLPRCLRWFKSCIQYFRQINACCSTATHSRSAADVSPAYVAPPFLVPYTNRPFGHQRRHKKRLTIVMTSLFDWGAWLQCKAYSDRDYIVHGEFDSSLWHTRTQSFTMERVTKQSNQKLARQQTKLTRCMLNVGVLFH